MPVLTPHVPDGLIDLMKALTKSILKEKPENIYEYAVQHFEKLITERDGSLDKGYERFRDEAIYFQCREKYEKVILKYQQIQLCTTKKQNPLDAKIDINEKSFGESIQTPSQPVQRKFKTRKLSSRKPSETLIAIKEEDDEEALRNELDNEMQRRHRAAFKIQKAFRKFWGEMKAGDNGSDGKVKMTEEVAALIIQRTLKTLFARKLAGKMEEHVCFGNSEKVSADVGIKSFELEAIVDNETVETDDPDKMISTHHGLKTPLRQNSDDQHPSLAFGERCSENDVNQATLASPLFSDSITGDEVDAARVSQKSLEDEPSEASNANKDKLTQGSNAKEPLTDTSTEQKSLLKLLKDEKSEKVDAIKNVRESNEKVVENPSDITTQSNQHKDQPGMEASEENGDNIESVNQDTLGTVSKPLLRSKTTSDEKLSPRNNNSDNLNDSPQEAVNQIQSDTKSHIDDTPQPKGYEIDKVTLADAENTNQNHSQLDVTDQKSSDSRYEPGSPDLLPEEEPSFKESTEELNKSEDIAGNTNKIETSVSSDQLLSEQSSPESLPTEQASLAHLLEATKQSSENSNTAAQNHNKRGQETDDNASNSTEQPKQASSSADKPNSMENSNENETTLNHQIDVNARNIIQQSNELSLSASKQKAEESSPILLNENSTSKMETNSTEKESLIQVLKDEKLLNGSNHTPAKTTEEQPPDADVSDEGVNKDEKQATLPIEIGLTNQKEENDSQTVLEKSLDDHKDVGDPDSVSDGNLEKKVSSSIIDTVANQETINSETIENKVDDETVNSMERKSDASNEQVVENVPQVKAHSATTEEQNAVKNISTPIKTDDSLEQAPSLSNIIPGLAREENEKPVIEIGTDTDLKMSVNASNEVVNGQVNVTAENVNEGESFIEKESLVKLLNHEKDTKSPKSHSLQNDDKYGQDAPRETVVNEVAIDGLKIDSQNLESDFKKETADILDHVEHELQSNDLLLQENSQEQSGNNMVKLENVNGPEIQPMDSLKQKSTEMEASKDIPPQITADDPKSNKPLSGNQKMTADIAEDTSKTNPKLANGNTAEDLTESDELKSDLAEKGRMENMSDLKKKDSEPTQQLPIQPTKEQPIDSEKQESGTSVKPEAEELKIVDTANQLSLEQSKPDNANSPSETQKEESISVNHQIKTKSTEMQLQAPKNEEIANLLEADSLDSTKPPSNFASPVPKEDEEVNESQNENKESYNTGVNESSYVAQDVVKQEDAENKKDTQLNVSKNDGVGFNNFDPNNLLEKIEDQKLEAVEEGNEENGEASTPPDGPADTTMNIVQNYEAEHESLTKSLNDFKNNSESLGRNSLKTPDSTNGGDGGLNPEIVEKNLNKDLSEAELGETVRDEKLPTQDVLSIQEDETPSGKLNKHNNVNLNVRSKDVVPAEENQELEANGPNSKSNKLNRSSSSDSCLSEAVIGTTESKLESIQENADELLIHDFRAHHTGNDDQPPSKAEHAMITTGPHEPNEKETGNPTSTNLTQENNGNEVNVPTDKGKDYDLHKNTLDTVDVKSSVEGISDASIIGKQLVEASNDVDMYNQINNGDTDCDKTNSVPDLECDIKNKEKVCDDAVSRNVMNRDKMSQNESINLVEENYNENVLADVKKDNVDSDDKQGMLPQKIVMKGSGDEAETKVRSNNVLETLVTHSNAVPDAISRSLKSKNSSKHELNEIEEKKETHDMQESTTDTTENTQKLLTELKLEPTGQSKLENIPAKTKLNVSTIPLLHHVDDNAKIIQNPIYADNEYEKINKINGNQFDSNNFENEENDHITKVNSEDLRKDGRPSSQSVDQKDNVLAEIEAQIVGNDELSIDLELNKGMQIRSDHPVETVKETVHYDSERNLPVEAADRHIDHSDSTVEKNTSTKLLQKDNENGHDFKNIDETQISEETGPHLDERLSEPRKIEIEDNIQTSDTKDTTGPGGGEKLKDSSEKLNNISSESETFNGDLNKNTLRQSIPEADKKTKMSDEAKESDVKAKEVNSISKKAGEERADEVDSTQKLGQSLRNTPEHANRPYASAQTSSNDAIHSSSYPMSTILSSASSLLTIDDNEVNKDDTTEKSVCQSDLNHRSKSLSSPSEMDIENLNPNLEPPTDTQNQATNEAEQEPKGILDTLKDMVSAASLGSIFNKNTQNSAEQQTFSKDNLQTKAKEAEKHDLPIKDELGETNDIDKISNMATKPNENSLTSSIDLSYLNTFLTSERNTYTEPSTSNKSIAGIKSDQYLSLKADNNYTNQPETAMPAEHDPETKDIRFQENDPEKCISDSQDTSVNKSISSQNMQTPKSDSAENFLEHTSNIKDEEQENQSIRESSLNSSSPHTMNVNQNEILSMKLIHEKVQKLEEHENAPKISEVSHPSRSKETNDKTEETTGHRRKRSIFDKNFNEDQITKETEKTVAEKTFSHVGSDPSLTDSSIASQTIQHKIVQSNPVRETKSGTVEPNLKQELLNQPESKRTTKIKEAEKCKDQLVKMDNAASKSNGSEGSDEVYGMKLINTVENNFLKPSKDGMESLDLQKYQPKHEKQSNVIEKLNDSNEKDGSLSPSCLSENSDHKVEGNVSIVEEPDNEKSTPHEPQILLVKSSQPRLGETSLREKMEGQISEELTGGCSETQVFPNPGNNTPNHDNVDVQNLKKIVKSSSSKEEQELIIQKDEDKEAAEKQGGGKTILNINSTTMGALTPERNANEMVSKVQKSVENTSIQKIKTDFIDTADQTFPNRREKPGATLLMDKSKELEVVPESKILTADTNTSRNEPNKDDVVDLETSKSGSLSANALMETTVLESQFWDDQQSAPTDSSHGQNHLSSPAESEATGKLIRKDLDSSMAFIPQLLSENPQKSEIEKGTFEKTLEKHPADSDFLNQDNHLFLATGKSAVLEEHNLSHEQALADSLINNTHDVNDLQNSSSKSEASEPSEKHLNPVSAIKSFIKEVQDRIVDFVSEKGSPKKESTEAVLKVNQEAQTLPRKTSVIKKDHTLSEGLQDVELQAMNADIKFNNAEVTSSRLAAEEDKHNTQNTDLDEMVLQTTPGSAIIADDLHVNENKTFTPENEGSVEAGSLQVSDDESIKLKLNDKRVGFSDNIPEKCLDDTLKSNWRENCPRPDTPANLIPAPEMRTEIMQNNSEKSPSYIDIQPAELEEPKMNNEQFNTSVEEPQVSDQLMNVFLVDLFLKSERNAYIEPRSSQVSVEGNGAQEVLAVVEEFSVVNSSSQSPVIILQQPQTQSEKKQGDEEVDNSESFAPKLYSEITVEDYQQNAAGNPENKLDPPKITKLKSSSSESIIESNAESALNESDLKTPPTDSVEDLKFGNPIDDQQQKTLTEAFSTSGLSGCFDRDTKKKDIISKSSKDVVTESPNIGSDNNSQMQDKKVKENPKIISKTAKQSRQKRSIPKPSAIKDMNIPIKNFGSEEKSNTPDMGDLANNPGKLSPEEVDISTTGSILTDPLETTDSIQNSKSDDLKDSTNEHRTPTNIEPNTFTTLGTCKEETTPGGKSRLITFDGKDNYDSSKNNNEIGTPVDPEFLLGNERKTSKPQAQTLVSNVAKETNTPSGGSMAIIEKLDPSDLENVQEQISHQETLDHDHVDSNAEPLYSSMQHQITEHISGSPDHGKNKPNDDPTTHKQKFSLGEQSGNEAFIEQTLLVAERKDSVDSISKKIDSLRKGYFEGENSKKLHMEDPTTSVNSPETLNAETINTSDSKMKPENENEIKSGVGFSEMFPGIDENKSSKLEIYEKIGNRNKNINENIAYSHERDEIDDNLNRKLSYPNEDRYNKFMILSDDVSLKSAEEKAESNLDSIESDELVSISKTTGGILLAQSTSKTLEAPATLQSLNDIEKLISEYNRKITKEFLTRERKFNNTRHINDKATVCSSNTAHEQVPPNVQINNVIPTVSKNQAEIKEPMITRAHHTENFVKGEILTDNNELASKEDEKISMGAEKSNQQNADSPCTQTLEDSNLTSEQIGKEISDEFLAIERKLYGPKSELTKKSASAEPTQQNSLTESTSLNHASFVSQDPEDIEPNIKKAPKSLQLAQIKLQSEKKGPILSENVATDFETNKDRHDKYHDSKDEDLDLSSEFVNIKISKEFLDTERKFYDIKEKSNDKSSTTMQYDEILKTIASKTIETLPSSREQKTSPNGQNSTNWPKENSSSNDNQTLSTQTKLEEPMSLETSKVINFVETKLQSNISETSLATKESAGPEVQNEKLRAGSPEDKTNNQLNVTSSLTALSAQEDQVNDMHEDKIISVAQKDDIQKSNVDFVLGSTRAPDDMTSENLDCKSIIQSEIQNDVDIPQSSKSLENNSSSNQANDDETISPENFAKNILQKPQFVPGHILKTSASCEDNERHFPDETTDSKSSHSTSNPELAQVLNAAADTIKKAFRSFIDQKDEIVAGKLAASAKDKDTNMTIVETNNTLDENVNNKARWYVGDDPIIPTIDQEAPENLDIELNLLNKLPEINEFEKPSSNIQTDVPQSEEVDRTTQNVDTIADNPLITHGELEKELGNYSPQGIQANIPEANIPQSEEVDRTTENAVTIAEITLIDPRELEKELGNDPQKTQATILPETETIKTTKNKQNPISSNSTDESKEEDKLQSLKTDINPMNEHKNSQNVELPNKFDASPQLDETVKLSNSANKLYEGAQMSEDIEESSKTSPLKSTKAKSTPIDIVVGNEECNEAAESTAPVIDTNEKKDENKNKNDPKTIQQESMLENIEPMAELASGPEKSSRVDDDSQRSNGETNSTKQKSNAAKAHETMLPVENSQHIAPIESATSTEFPDDAKSSSGVSSSEEMPPATEKSQVPETAPTINEHPPEITQALSIDSESSPRTDVENLDISVYGEDSLEAMYYSLKKHELLLDKMHKQATICKSASSERPSPVNGNTEECSEEIFHEKLDSEVNAKQVDSEAGIEIKKELNAENKNVPKRKVSRNESYETACALRPITSATVDVKEDTPSYNKAFEPGLKNGTEYPRERKLSRNESYETACTIQPITISPRTKQELDSENPINLAKQRTEQFMQHLHTTPSYNESLDEITAEEIRRNVLAYSISEADSDYCEAAAEHTNAVFNDFNISTAFENTPSTDTDSTIISAATKIQAGARGFLTRRRLRRASVATTSFSDRRPSFGNDAISESLENLIEEQDAARRIQKSFRRYRSRKTRQSAPSLRNNLTNESSSKSSNDSSGEKAPMIIDVKLEQKPTAKKRNLNESTSNADSFGEASHSMGKNDGQSVETGSDLMKEDTSISFEGVNLAARRMTLQRGDAVQRNSTGEDENVSVSRSGSDNQDEKDENLAKKLLRSKSSGTERRQNKPERPSNMDRAKRLGPRQKTMPVQIDFEILRVLPRHLRRRIRSADQQTKTKDDS